MGWFYFIINLLYFTYKTTNKINGRYYFGVHATKNINDGYLGSGKLLTQAINLYGSDNFERQIINYHNSYKSALNEEANLVTQVEVDDRKCYNVCLGGGMPPIKNGENHHNFGKKLEWAKNRMSSNSNPSKGKLGIDSHSYGTTVVFDPILGKNCRISMSDPRYINGEVTHINKGKITVRDNSNNVFQVSKDDPRWIAGELQHINKGIKRMKKKGDSVK